MMSRHFSKLSTAAWIVFLLLPWISVSADVTPGAPHLGEPTVLQVREQVLETELSSQGHYVAGASSVTNSDSMSEYGYTDFYVWSVESNEVGDALQVQLLTSRPIDSFPFNAYVSFQISPDERYLAVGGNTVRPQIFSLPDLEEISTFPDLANDRYGGVRLSTSLVWSGDSRLVGMVERDGAQFAVWDVETSDIYRYNIPYALIPIGTNP